MKRKQILALLLILSLNQVAPVMRQEILAKGTNETASGAISIFTETIQENLNNELEDKKVVVTGYAACDVNIRSNPDIESEIVTVLKYGDEIKYIKDDYIIDKSNYVWSKVVFEGKEYYICSKFISQTPPNFITMFR